MRDRPELEFEGREEWGPNPALWAGLLAPEAVRLERLDDTLCEVAHLVQHFNGRLGFKRKSVGDYEADLAVSQHSDSFNVARIGREASQVDGDGFESAKVSFEGDPIWPVPRNPLVADLAHRQRGRDSTATHLHDGNVLVSNVEVMHSAEQFVASPIWLERPDNSEDSGVSPFHLRLNLVLKCWEGFPRVL